MRRDQQRRAGAGGGFQQQVRHHSGRNRVQARGRLVEYQHACVENFLEAGRAHGLDKHDLVSNLNWFMNVPVDPDGALGIVDGRSAPGKRVALRAEVDTLVLVSNCPQINNPCNGFNPTPVQAQVWDGDPS